MVTKQTRKVYQKVLRRSSRASIQTMTDVLIQQRLVLFRDDFCEFGTFDVQFYFF